MNNTGQSGEKIGYRIILLLVVGLTAFSSAMKELNQVQQLSLDAGHLFAQWSGKVTPAEIPQAPETPQTVVKLESCQLKQSAPSVELPWLAPAAQAAQEETSQPTPAPPALTQRAKPSSAQIAKLKKLRGLNTDPVQLEVRIAPDHDADSDDAITSELPVSLFKAKIRKHSTFRMTPRDRETFLKTLNRSFNLRSAS